MKNLLNKKILFIICGGISAYKSLETIRLFKKNGADIKTILTTSAKEFITPLSIISLSQGKVYSDLFSVENEAEMDHISLSRWADIIVIAPATANTISKLAQGTSDDLASTVILASDKNIILAPAMNVRMWEHQSTKNNLKKVISYGYKIIGPVIGDMACGEFGEGKMSDPSEIFSEINIFLSLLIVLFDIGFIRFDFALMFFMAVLSSSIDPIKSFSKSSSMSIYSFGLIELSILGRVLSFVICGGLESIEDVRSTEVILFGDTFSFSSS